MSNSKKIVIRLVKDGDFHLPFYRLYVGKKCIKGSYVSDSLIIHAFFIYGSSDKYVFDENLERMYYAVSNTIFSKFNEVYLNNVYRP